LEQKSIPEVATVSGRNAAEQRLKATTENDGQILTAFLSKSRESLAD
jgi:hypothetical protein